MLSLLEDGPYSKLEAKQKVATLLNWLGPDAYKMYNDELDFPGKDENDLQDVIDVFENHFKPKQNMIHAWYRIGSLFSNSCKSQTQFMYNLKELARQCEFTNKDEIVKFLFQIHNKHERVREELLKSVTKDTNLNQCLELARCVEANMQSEELSKKMGDIILDPQSVKVDTIKHKKLNVAKHPTGQESSDDESHKSNIKCSKCGIKHAKRKCPAFGKECL